MAGRVDWNGKAAAEAVAMQTARALTRATLLVQRHARELVNVPGPTKTHPENPPSAPGEPPHKRTGNLQNSIQAELPTMLELVGRVGLPLHDGGGVSLAYGRWLELGTVKMQPRPYLRRALYDKAGEIAAMFKG